MPTSLTAADLYAISQSTRNEGDVSCHWCGSPARRFWLHDDDPIVPFTPKGQPGNCSLARRPDQPWVCVGCWRFRWKKTTVRFLGGGHRDGQCPMAWSWWIEEGGAWGIRVGDKLDREALYGKLLKPPRRFCLALLGDEVRPGSQMANHLQQALANDCAEVKADTRLDFTLNGIPHRYSVYELESALRHGPEGKEPGVGVLLRLLGEFKLPDPDPQKKDRGRHPPQAGNESARKLITPRSGLLVG